MHSWRKTMRARSRLPRKRTLEELGETVEHLSLENARMLARHSKQQRIGGRTFRAAAMLNKARL